jgi:hypothetical protein
MVLEHISLSEAQIHAPLPCLFSHFIFYLMECSPEQPSYVQYAFSTVAQRAYTLDPEGFYGSLGQIDTSKR